MHQLPSLSFHFNDLEPYIDARTMEIHYTKHHQAYVDNLNKVLSAYPIYTTLSIETLLKELSTIDIPETDKVKIKNFGGGHSNHSFFWSIMGPKKDIDPQLEQRILKTFHSLDQFKQQFTQAALGLFGSGWTWLVEDEHKELKIYTLPNQDSPYLFNHLPLIGLDVWEHAYYLQYQNKRAEYIQNWWHVLKLLP